MSKKDYIAIAEIINDSFKTCKTDKERMLMVNLAVSLCNVFQADNAMFDRDRFLQTAGMREGVVRA